MPKSKAKLIVGAVMALVVLVATYLVLAPASVVANETSNTYSQVGNIETGTGSATISESLPVGAAPSPGDPAGAEQALGSAELVEAVPVDKPDRQPEVPTTRTEGGETYTLRNVERSGDGAVARYESTSAGDDADSGLGSAELVERVG